MTHHDVPDRDLVAWFTEDATGRAPARLLDAIAADTRARPQLPAWLVTLRGESMGATARGSLRSRRTMVAVAVMALLALLVAIIASGRPQDPHGGLLAFIRDGDAYLANADGSDAHVVLRADGVAFSTVAWSATGMLALDGDSGVVVLDVRTGKTTFVGGHSPAWSPDGRQLAVQAVVPGQPINSAPVGLRIVDATTFATVAVHPIAASGLSWSPNGRWIAATGGPGLVRIDVRTGELVQLDRPSGHLDAQREVTWSPDSTRVAFVRYRDDPSGTPRCTGMDCRVDVIVENADGSDAQVLNLEAGTADQPSWSPDGSWIAFRKLAPGSQEPLGLQLVRADGTGERTLLTAPLRGFFWSPAGDRVIYTIQGPSEPATVWEVSLAGDTSALGIYIDTASAQFATTGLDVAAQALGGPDRVEAMPRFTAAGPVATPEIVTPAAARPADPSTSWPTIAADIQYGCEPVLIDSATGLVTKVAKLCDPAADPPSYVAGSSWSPTGAAYVVLRDDTLLQSTLTILGRDGATQFEQTVPLPVAGWAWAPDGSRLALIVKGDVWVLAESSARTWSVVEGAVGGAIGIEWSPDGRQLAVGRDDGQLLIGGSDGSGLQSLGTLLLPAAWAPDGSRFVFVRDGDAWVGETNGSIPHNTSQLPLGGALGASWSPDGTRIVVLTGSGLLIEAPDGSRQRWLDFGVDRPFSAAWAPDSASFAVELGGSVLIVHVDGSPSIRIDRAGSPSWSPDGRFLLIRDTSYGRLAVANADGSGLRELTVVTQSDLGDAVWVR